MRSQHCGYWCPGAKAPGHQYPQCWLNIHCIGPVSYKNIAHKVNSIRKLNHILKKMTQSFNGSYWEFISTSILFSIITSSCWLLFTTHDNTNIVVVISNMVNTLRPRQDGCHFADDIFTCIFFNENCWVKFSLKYVRKGPIDNNPALVQIMRPHHGSLGLNMIISSHFSSSLMAWKIVRLTAFNTTRGKKQLSKQSAYLRLISCSAPERLDLFINPVFALILSL